MTAKTISRDRANELIRYDPESGKLFWKKNRKGGVKAGEEAGSRHSDGYVEIKVDGCRCFAHRLIWLLQTGSWPDFEIDHIDHDRANNRWGNLRSVGRVGNSRNRSISVANRSGATGVYWAARRKKWAAQITLNGKQYGLGYYAEFEDAVAARKKAERRHGFHSGHGAQPIAQPAAGVF